MQLMLKNRVCLWTSGLSLSSNKLKKNICKTFYCLKMKRIPKGISEIKTSFTLHEMHVDVGYGYIIIHFIFFFFNHPTSIKWFDDFEQLLQPLCGKMLDWLNFCLREILGLIHALEKRYYQNKTQLRYNFEHIKSSLQNNCATSWENPFMPYANNKGADISTCSSRNFKTLASIISWAGRVVSYLVGNSEDRISLDEAQIVFLHKICS